ncbi:MAG: DUF3467 domain-containing protein [Candidatus Cloacimonetes bacterium]|nr:DUF3467 domain-containing protein [Candidatus Cloacimonadota bacterium]
MEKKKLNVKIDEKVGEGTYSNMCMVTFSLSEFILDFGRFLPGLPDARILSRVVTSPQHAKNIMRTLQANIEKFEKQHGEIKLPGSPDDREIGFKSTGQNP